MAAAPKPALVTRKASGLAALAQPMQLPPGPKLSPPADDPIPVPRSALEHRFNDLVRRLREQERELKARQERMDGLIAFNGQQVAEVSTLKLALAKSEAEKRELEAGLRRALDLAERYRKLRPIVPNLDRYERKK
jgi:hypothetical protein